MQLAVKRTILLFAIILACAFGSVSVALAQDTSVDAEISADVQLGVTPLGKPRPLQILHDARSELKDQKREGLQNLQDKKVEFRETMQTNMKLATSGPMRRDVIQNAQDRFGEIRDARQELRGNVKERLQALFRTHLGSAMVRLNNAIEHFHKFITRIESRIEKLKERGVDTASAEGSLEVAVDAVATAEVTVNALETLVSSVASTSDPAAVKEEVRAAVKKAVESVKAAHRALKATVQELVASVRQNTDVETDTEINSSTTVDTSNDEVE